MYDKKIIMKAAPWLTDVVVTAVTASTQQDAMASGLTDTLYLTERQTGTYGRFHRQYFAAATGGIYMSIGLGADRTVPQLTVLAAAAVVTAVEALTGKKALIKWVNDIYLGDKKIAGILAEARQTASGRQQLILGMGINFAIKEFPTDIAERAGSLFAADERPVASREQLIGEIWRQFHLLAATDFLAIYRAHSLVLGRQVGFERDSVSYEGRALAILDTGALLVALPDGSETVLNSGEISLKSW